jgi:chromosome segregation ATPase
MGSLFLSNKIIHMKNSSLILIGKNRYHQMTISYTSKKILIGILLTALMMLLLGISGCSSSTKKEEKPVQMNSEAQEQAEQDAINAETKKEMEEYTQQLNAQIAENEKNLIDFNARIANQKGDAKAEYEKKIAELNIKNSDLKKKLADFKTNSKSQWESFKSEFNSDMEQLGKALKNLTVNNER